MAIRAAVPRFRAGQLYAVPFDAAAVRVTGPPVAMVEGVREDPAQGAAQFTVSSTGTLAYVSGGLEKTDVVRVDRQGRLTPLMPSKQRLRDQPRLSPKGRQLAITSGAAMMPSSSTTWTRDDSAV